MEEVKYLEAQTESHDFKITVTRDGGEFVAVIDGHNFPIYANADDPAAKTSNSDGVHEELRDTSEEMLLHRCAERIKEAGGLLTTPPARSLPDRGIN